MNLCSAVGNEARVNATVYGSVSTKSFGRNGDKHDKVCITACPTTFFKS
jgi:hypothetical protein